MLFKNVYKDNKSCSLLILLSEISAIKHLGYRVDGVKYGDNYYKVIFKSGVVTKLHGVGLMTAWEDYINKTSIQNREGESFEVDLTKGEQE